jgi:hypothetical protein
MITQKFGGCTAHRPVVALGATASHRSGRNGVKELHFLQIEYRISVAQVAQTSVREYV